MKRFLVFSSDHYYPVGGWDDFVSDHDTLEEARAVGESKFDYGKFETKWVHVVDAETRVVEDFDKNGWQVRSDE